MKETQSTVQDQPVGGAQRLSNGQIKGVYPGWQHRRAAMGESLLTVLRVVPAAAIAANVLYLFPDVTVDRKGHVVVVMRMLAVPFLVAERHDFDQAERLFLRLLHRHGRVFSAARAEPSAVHDGGRRIHRRVIDRLEHLDAKTGASVLAVATACI